MSIHILTVDPGEATVNNRRYRLRRPVLMLTATQPDLPTESFLSFARSIDRQQLLRTMFAPVEPPVPATVPSHVRQLDHSSSSS